MCLFAVLHCFDPAGHHLESDIWLAGTAADGEDVAVARAEQHLAHRLDGLADRQYGDIAIRPFSVTSEGAVFGLISQAADDEEDLEDCASLLPDGLDYFSPWDGLPLLDP